MQQAEKAARPGRGTAKPRANVVRGLRSVCTPIRAAATLMLWYYPFQWTVHSRFQQHHPPSMSRAVGRNSAAVIWVSSAFISRKALELVLQTVGLRVIPPLPDGGFQQQKRRVKSPPSSSTRMDHSIPCLLVLQRRTRPDQRVHQRAVQ